MYEAHTGALGARRSVCKASQREFDAKVMELMERYKNWHADATISGKNALRMARRCDGGQNAWTRGWLYRFQQRTGVWFAERHGEAASVDMTAVEAGRVRLRVIMAGYEARNIYNMDETAFFYEQQPRGTLTTDKKARGKKRSKTRITMAVAANADGSDRLPLLFIGTARVPVPLRGHDVYEELGVEYTNSGKAWMNTEIYHDWLLALNDEMQSKQRHILLLVDNVSTHNSDDLELSHIRVEKLPANTTAILQPCDQGIIKALKDHFHETKSTAELDAFFNGDEYTPVNIYTAMKHCAEGWRQVSEKTIRNCWSHAHWPNRQNGSGHVALIISVALRFCVPLCT